MDLAKQSAQALVSAMQNGSLSAVDLMDATYDQIEIWNPHVNALVSLLDRSAAIALARAADQGPRRGALHGLPIAVKDLANAKGFPTSMGSPLFKDTAPLGADDLMVARMRAAGALIIGKSNTPEFGLGSHTVNPVHGPTRNPWDLTKSAGGSSGGAAVALATGMLALADGSDMMGSLRNPAGWNGVYGLRPTWGAVPSEPESDGFLHQLATLGPMARTPQDLALLLSVQSGPDRRQPYGIDLPRGRPKGERLRIGWIGDWGGAYPMEPGILETCEQALEILSTLGHGVEPCDPGFGTEALWSSWTTLRSWQVAAKLAPAADHPGTAALLNEQAQWEVARGRALSALDVHAASAIRAQWFTQVMQLFERYDVLALPTAQCWPFDIDRTWPTEIAGREMDTYHRWMEVVVPASLIGLPALAVPAGHGAQGHAKSLPTGLQLIGPRGSDFALIALAETFHAEAPWTEMRPPLPGSDDRE